MYDGATALGEALSVALAAKRKKAVVLPATLNPRYRRVVETMLAGEGVTIIDAPAGPDGTTDPDGPGGAARPTTVAAVRDPESQLPGPGRTGRRTVAAWPPRPGAVVVAAVNPVSLSVLKTPAEYGAELAVGEAQPFGINPSWGGPLLGFLACTDTAQAPHPRPRRRPHHRQPRAGRLRADPADPRAAHPPREGHQQHLHQPGTERPAGHGLPGHAGGRGPGRTGRGQPDPHHGPAPTGRPASTASACPSPGPVFNETVLRLDRPAADFRAFARSTGVLAGIPLDGIAGCGEGDLLVTRHRKTHGRRDRELRPPAGGIPGRYRKDGGDVMSNDSLPNNGTPGQRWNASLPESLFDKGAAGRRGLTFPRWDGDRPVSRRLCLPSMRRAEPADLPALSEPEVMRHFTALSQPEPSHRARHVSPGQLHHEVQPAGQRAGGGHARPGGSASGAGARGHPGSAGGPEAAGGTPSARSPGFAACSLIPAAGAHGEYLGMLVIRALHLANGDADRDEILIPDSAHGTNPASVVIAGMKPRTIASRRRRPHRPGCPARGRVATGPPAS